jgi:hypothetical protein
VTNEKQEEPGRWLGTGLVIGFLFFYNLVAILEKSLSPAKKAMPFNEQEAMR